MGTAWDIYAQRLMHLGYGHPLWGPEPSATSGEVRIGDVGYLRDGHFCFLFNAMFSADDPVNSQQGVPDSFVVFNVPRSPLHWEDEITDTQLHSKTVRSIEIAATAPASETVAPASVGLRYKCNADSGALLLLKQPAHKTVLDCPLHIKKYMMTHLASWYDFANARLGIGLEDKDIIFVSGFLKTTVWAAAAFSTSSDSAELIINGGCFVPAASGAFRVSVARDVQASVASRAGPQQRVSTWADGGDRAFKYDQCIFLNYYKMKYRGMLRLPRVIRAAAGPHTLPGKYDHDDSSPDISSSLSTSGESQESEYVGTSYDPVNELLDYILKDPGVEIACAEVQDLSRLFKTEDIPSDLKTALEALEPHIITDESGIGMVGFLPRADYKSNFVPGTSGTSEVLSVPQSHLSIRHLPDDEMQGHSVGKPPSNMIPTKHKDEGAAIDVPIHNSSSTMLPPTSRKLLPHSTSNDGGDSGALSKGWRGSLLKPISGFLKKWMKGPRDRREPRSYSRTGMDYSTRYCPTLTPSTIVGGGDEEDAYSRLLNDGRPRESLV